MNARLPCAHALVVVLFAALAGCATNPVTGERQLALISEDQEIEMGRAAAADVRRSIGLVDDPSLQEYVSAIGLRLARDSERPALPWSFAVVDDPTPNAFALPGGFIFITRGMMNLMDSEAELASVLGHEIGHVTARHSVTQISQQQLAQLGFGLGMIFFPEAAPYGDAVGAGLQLLFLKHGRDAERQADELGFRYALDDGYRMDEMADVFATLARAGGEQRSALPAWLSTHPAPAERVQEVRQRVAALPAAQRGSRVGRAEYLDQIDGLVYGQNPRHGFFQEGTFYHPDLRFKFDMPADWRKDNLTQAVVGVSPRNDAAVQLTLAGDVSPANAASRFASQNGVGVLQSSRDTINGLPAALTAFDAVTQQGRLRGLVAHIGYRGQTYQLVGYTTADRFGAYASGLERLIRSFAPVNDDSILNVQPDRIDIVTLPRAMTLAEFNRRYSSSVPIEELAVLNQVEGPSSTLDAGARVKRVTS